ncbi:uncharacterized protein LOC106470193 isoform X2 [Limulus polyphemus]|uniref:Uncharacterized protein LOC106470193 isoform X2 n=1 Tax=Limulus polyphemus TaxID=6850 RepID=A0ABM1TF53_LIMPO|nr:uncharacterized protein LOC106470193 isoform X2 [Limulus polyphemus]
MTTSIPGTILVMYPVLNKQNFFSWEDRVTSAVSDTEKNIAKLKNYMKSPVLRNKTLDKGSVKHIGNKEDILRCYMSHNVSNHAAADSVALKSPQLLQDHQPIKNNTFPVELLWKSLHEQAQMISNLQKSVRELLEARNNRKVHIEIPKRKNMLDQFEENIRLKPEVPCPDYLGSRRATQFQEYVGTMSSDCQTTQLASLFSSECLTLRSEMDTLRTKMCKLS